MERKQQGRKPVGKSDSDHPEAAAGHDGKPHDGDELERVSELADGIGEVGPPEAGSISEHYCPATVSICGGSH
jgi:hypothetical protein